jgi:hypothetical protein
MIPPQVNRSASIRVGPIHVHAHHYLAKQLTAEVPWFAVPIVMLVLDLR